MKEIIIGKEYENTRSDYRLITPLEYNSASGTYKCNVSEMTDDVDENGEIVWKEYEADLTAYDIRG